MQPAIVRMICVIDMGGLGPRFIRLPRSQGLSIPAIISKILQTLDRVGMDSVGYHLKYQIGILRDPSRVSKVEIWR